MDYEYAQCLIKDFKFFLLPKNDHRFVYFRLPRHQLTHTIQPVLNQSKIMKISGKEQNIGLKGLEYYLSVVLVYWVIY